jgi:glycosyltransferase involved in cell wall biosynthesis
MCTGITPFVTQELERIGLHPSAMLPVGVDTKRFVRNRPPANNMPTVLFVGTVIERKGVLSVLEIARRVTGAQFVLVGAARDGFDQIVSSRIQALGLRNVQLLGPRPQDEILQFMQSSDIFLLPSHLEGIPKVTLEAAATGLPCIVFDSYETPSVINGVTGFQVKSLDEMVDRVMLLVQNTRLRLEMGDAAVRHAKTFDWDVIVPKWQEAYLRMAGKPARLQPSAVLH